MTKLPKSNLALRYALLFLLCNAFILVRALQPNFQFDYISLIVFVIGCLFVTADLWAPILSLSRFTLTTGDNKLEVQLKSAAFKDSSLLVPVPQSFEGASGIAEFLKRFYELSEISLRGAIAFAEQELQRSLLEVLHQRFPKRTFDIEQLSLPILQDLDLFDPKKVETYSKLVTIAIASSVITEAESEVVTDKLALGYGIVAAQLIVYFQSKLVEQPLRSAVNV